MLESALRPPSLPPIRSTRAHPAFLGNRYRQDATGGADAETVRAVLRHHGAFNQAKVPCTDFSSLDPATLFVVLHCSWLLLMSTSSVWSRRDRFLPTPIRRPWLFNASRGGLGSSANPPLGRIPL